MTCADEGIPVHRDMADTTALQVEKFIEGVYPTQTARTLKLGTTVDHTQPALTPEQEAKKAAEAAEAKQDVVYMAIAVFGTLIFITLCMVRAWISHIEVGRGRLTKTTTRRLERRGTLARALTLPGTSCGRARCGGQTRTKRRRRFWDSTNRCRRMVSCDVGPCRCKVCMYIFWCCYHHPHSQAGSEYPNLFLVFHLGHSFRVCSRCWGG